MIRFLLICAIIFTQSCVTTDRISIRGKGDMRMEQVEFTDLDNWDNDDHQAALRAFLKSCQKFAKMPQNRVVGGQIDDITAEDFRDVCEIADAVKSMSSMQAKNFFENWFRPFEISVAYNTSYGTFTGYYEASLNGSKVKNDRFKFPIYAKPKDLGSDPYLTREQIEEGALKDKDLELLYVDDKADLFFLHIQGSGRIKTPQGTEIRVGFAARNNQPFVAIASYMLEKGLISRDQMSPSSIKEWIRNNPDKADEVMNYNPAYVFFRILDGESSIGAQGVSLTPEHSLAVDNQYIPYGLPLWVEASLKKKGGQKEKFNRLMIAQDTGNAIRGIVRGDIFFGYGKEAEEKASAMYSQGKYYALLPINVVDKLSGR